MDEKKETNRIEAFSDGVFAVAITLLVLNLKIPALLDDTNLWHELLDQWPTVLAFVTSFAFIGIMWINHHRLFILIKRADTGLMLLNLLLMLLIVFVPYPTALLAEQYAAHPGQHAAAIVYSGTFVLLACCFFGLWHYASYHNRLLGKDVETNAVNAISRQFAFGPLSYLAVFGVSWFSTLACIGLSFALALFFALPGQVLRLEPEDR